MSNSSAYIHEGIWTNWFYGPIFGQTLTLTRCNGGLLVVFFAIYVTITATCAWHITSFILHQVLAACPDVPVSRLHLQRQAVLRNTKTASGTAWELCQLGLSWRGKTEISLRRTMPFGVLAVIHLAAFGLASIFVSKVASGAEIIVLIRSPNCGYAQFPEDDGNDWESRC
jgi:hypothetical protein